MDAIAIGFGVVLILTALVVYIAGVRNKYLDIFKVMSAKSPCVTPWNLAMSVEHPWMAKLIVSEPLETPVAQFLVSVIRAKQLYLEDVCIGFGASVNDLNTAIDITNSAVGDDAQNAAWATSGGRLAELVPWQAPIIVNYVKTLKTSHDLQTLYAGGFYAYAINFYSGSTSVDAIWDYLFSLTPPSDKGGADACSDAASTAVSGAMGGAGLGAMVGGPFGMVIGGLIGAFSSVAAKGQLRCA